MRKIAYLLVVLFVGNVYSQNECHIKFNLFSGNVKAKRYEEAKPDLKYLLENCPKLSLATYQYGEMVAEKTKDYDLVKRVYEGRVANFPNKGIAKAHNDYVDYALKHKLISDDETYRILDLVYNISPKDMGVRNIQRYFQFVSDKYKDTEPQKVFEVYDNLMEAVNEKLDDYNKRLPALLVKEEQGTLTSKEKRSLRAVKVNSNSLGQVEGNLDKMIESIATCERLIPILSRDFESKRNDATWLRGSVSRLHRKDCKTDPLYAQLARAYAEASPTPEAYNFLAGVLENSGDVSGANKMRKKAFDLETDPNKKAKLKLTEAYDASGSSRKRALALEALRYNPNYGKAYLLIANLYASSVNSCGNDVFEKKMVYVAALNKAIKAQQVDPGCGAGRYISSYRSHIPNTKDLHKKGVSSGSSYRIGCWIGETVRVP